MDPLDHVCIVCDRPVPGGSTRVLARRDDIAVLQVACPGCGSRSLDFQAQRPVVSADDVLDMHQFLASWRGSLAELL